MSRALVIRVAALGIGFAVALLLAEIALRALGAAPTDGVITVTERDFQRIPGILSPSQSVIDRRNPNLPHRVTTDSLGYRGDEIAFAKAPGERRVLFVGDSFAYGDFVNDSETLPAQLEQRLRATCRGVRVVNAGLGDATIVDEAQLIERGLKLSPDLVILLFSENDVLDLNRTSTWERLASNRAAKSRFPLSIVYPVMRHAALWNFALSARAQWRIRRDHASANGTARPAVGGPVDSLILALRRSYARNLTALRDTLSHRGIPFMLVVYPSHFAIKDTSMREQVAWATRTADSANVSTANLLTPLKASGLPAESLYLLPFDGHPSPRGYAIAASYLADRVGPNAALRKSCR